MVIIVKFSGGIPVYHPRYKRPKKFSFVVLFFAVFGVGPKFAKSDTQCTYKIDRSLQRRFPNDDIIIIIITLLAQLYLVAFRIYSRSSRRVVRNRAEKLFFGGAKFWGIFSPGWGYKF